MVTGFVERVKGKSVIATQYMQTGSAFYSNAQDNITATAGGNQGNSFLIAQQQNRVTTVVTAADSVRLPPAIPGACVALVNDATSGFAMNVFPSSAAQGGVSGGDRIFDTSLKAQNAAISQTVALGVVLYYCFTAGTWRTK
jgi:hypothetical protein